MWPNRSFRLPVKRMLFSLPEIRVSAARNHPQVAISLRVW